MNQADGKRTTARPALDPGVRDFVVAVNAAVARQTELERLPRDRARRVLEKIRAPWARGGPAMDRTFEKTIAGREGPIRVRIHHAQEGERRPALVYLHGGGWTYFSINTHDRLMREYAARSGVAVVGVDYALSPEARYPVALEQVLDVVAALRAEGESYGIDPSRLAAGGDSAGANLALAAALRLRESGESDALRALVLNYGAYDVALSESSVRRFGGPDYMLGGEEMHEYWRNYVHGPADFDDPLVCPLRAHLAGLPPAFLTIPECDVLTEQNLAMADALREAGVDAEAVVYAGATHSFLEAVAISGLADAALSDASAWLRARLGGSGPNSTVIGPEAKAGPPQQGNSD